MRSVKSEAQRENAMIGVFLNTMKYSRYLDKQQRPQQKDGKTSLETYITERERKKTEHQLKSKDQHHTTLHSGQPWLGWGSPEEEEEGRYHKQEKQKHKKQSEKPWELKEKPVEDRELRQSIFYAGCITVFVSEQCAGMWHQKKKNRFQSVHGLICISLFWTIFFNNFF